MYSVPAAAVGFRSSALMMRLTRSSMLEVLRQDYIRTARSKGASERTINYYHALKNAMLPVVTVIGIEAAFLLGGLIVTETVFNIPGVARFLVEAIRWRDYPMVQNLVMFIAIVVVTINFIIDMLYAALDPRIKYGRLANRRAPRESGERSVSTLDFNAELAAAGANVTARWGAVRFFIRRYPLGAIGAVIMALFVLAAVFAPLHHRLRPAVDQRRRLAGPAERGALARLRFHGPRRLQPHHLRRAHLARGQRRLDAARLVDRRHARAAVRVICSAGST